MQVSTAMAAAFFLKSFRNNSDLNSLIQNLYYTKPFTYEGVLNRLLMEDNRREQKAQEDSLVAFTRPIENYENKPRNFQDKDKRQKFKKPEGD